MRTQIFWFCSIACKWTALSKSFHIVKTYFSLFAKWGWVSFPFFWIIVDTTNIQAYLYICGIYICLYICILWKVKVAQSCLTRCNPMDYTVHGILQSRILGWVAFPVSRGSSQLRDQTQVSLIAGRFFTSWATYLCKCHLPDKKVLDIIINSLLLI